MWRRSRLRASFGLALAAGLGLRGTAAEAEALTPLQVSVANADCPERPVLEEALARRGLGAVPDGARFRLQLAGAGGALDLTLRDDDGEVLLARTLAAQECAALADTVAMLVERRLAGIVWRAPPVAPPAPVAQTPAPPPPPVPDPDPPTARAPVARVVAPAEGPSRPWALEAQLGALFATGFEQLGVAPGPQLAARALPPQPFALRLSAGWLVHDGIPVSTTGQARIDRVPIALFAGYSLRRRGFELDIGPCAEVELLFAETRDVAVPGHDARTALRAGPAAWGTVEIASHLWLGIHAGALFVVSGWHFFVSRVSDPTARTRYASQTLALELGAALGYRLGP